MKTKIDCVEKWEDKGIIIRFLYLDKVKFTKLTHKSLSYWRKFRKVEEFKIGLKINVFKVPQTKFYKIIEVYK